MLLNETKEYVEPLSQEEDIKIAQSIAAMPKPPSEAVLERFKQVAESTAIDGPLEAYETAQQLQEFLKRV